MKTTSNTFFFTILCIFLIFVYIMNLYYIDNDNDKNMSHTKNVVLFEYFTADTKKPIIKAIKKSGLPLNAKQRILTLIKKEKGKKTFHEAKTVVAPSSSSIINDPVPQDILSALVVPTGSAPPVMTIVGDQACVAGFCTTLTPDELKAI